uniref:Uncharacterized protein n=1 Tax=Rhizophora mucronata TaxID=61149 RepID=A0A2P2MFB0_RHIMU
MLLISFTYTKIISALFFCNHSPGFIDRFSTWVVNRTFAIITVGILINFASIYHLNI